MPRMKGLHGVFKNNLQEIVIDNYEWFTIHKAENEVLDAFRKNIRKEKYCHHQ